MISLVAISDPMSLLPAALREPTVVAVPFFVVMILLEGFAAWKLQDEEKTASKKLLPSGDQQHAAGEYRIKDSVASISMGAISLITSAIFKSLFLILYSVVYVYVAPWHLPINQVWSWLVTFVVVDFGFYWSHRVGHRVRLIWATHQAHHSSEYFNLGTALRQKWNPTMGLALWIPYVALGFHPAMIFFSMGVNLVFQFVVHTERVHKMWRPVEFIMNTPSHHRVHHGSDPLYLDRNYAGTFIIWDRLFGTFQEELSRPLYGLTKSVDTFNIWKLQTHEYVSIARDVKKAGTWREKLGYVFGPPGWTPEEGAPVHVGTIKVTPEMRKQASWKKEDVDVVA